MKKLLIITSILFILTACGSASSGTDPASQSKPSAGTLPAATQLIVGTLKLEDSAQAVTAEQAQQLLPLWQTMLVLENSDTAADQEKEALVAQIQETMTAGQIQSIQAMNLTRADMASLIQQQGPVMSSSQNSNGDNSERGSFPRDEFPGGGMPPGGMPGGGFPGGSQSASADQIATAQAVRQANTDFIPPALINAVIDYLQEKAGS
jgi:hypothetical protein